MKRVWLAIFFGFLMCTGGVSALADDRDEEIFGSKPEEVSEPVSPSPSPSGSVPAGSSPVRQSLGLGLGLNLESLTLGARLDLQMRANQRESEAVRAATFEKANFFDLYLDGKLSEQNRSFLRLRFYENEKPASTETSNQRLVAIDEAWLKFNDSGFFYTIGKQHLRWGSGQFWNPTDFLSQETRDPFFDFDNRLGLHLLKVHYPVEKLGQNYYFILSYGNAERIDGLSFAVRAETILGEKSELALTWVNGQQGRHRLGADLSTSVSVFDLHFENALTHDRQRVLYKDNFDPASGIFPKKKDLSASWLYQGVGGITYTFNYTDSDAMTLGGEYFYNEAGYDSRELEFYALMQGQADFLYLARQYFAGFVRLPQPFDFNNTTLLLSALHNRSDGTSTARLSSSWAVMQGLNAEFWLSHCFGHYGEFCFSVPDAYRSSITTAAQSPGQEGLEKLLEPAVVSTLGIRFVAEF